MNFTIDVDRIADGISEQPARQRLPGHTETAWNILPSVADGAQKRSGSIFVTDIAAADPNAISPNLSGSAYRLHAIERDASERYLAVSGDSTIRIFHEDGTEATVSITAAAEAYLDSGSADEDEIRLRTFADTTFLVNTTVFLGTVSADDFEVRRVFPNPSSVFSFTAAVNAHMRAEVDDEADQAGYYKYTLSGDTTLTYGRIDFAIFTDAWSQPFAGNWDAGANQPAGFVVSYSRRRLTGFTGASWTFATLTLTKTGAFAGWTFVTGDRIYITAGTGHTVGWYEIASRTSDDAVVLKANAGLAGADNANTECNDSDSKCRIGDKIEISFDLAQEVITTMHDIAAVIQRELRLAGAENMCCCWVPASGGGGSMQLTGPYRSTHGKVYEPTTPTVAGVYDLTAATRPFNSTGVTNTAGSGSLSTSAETRPPESRWTKVAAPNQPQAAPDPAKMPVSILRTAVGPPAVFAIAVIDWNDRLDGDEFSNPLPDVFTSGTATIADLAIHRNRVALLASDRVLFSQDGDLYNFFANDAENIVDSDPIEVVLGGEQVAVGDFLAPFRNAVQVFTLAGRQFDVAGGTERLTQETVQLNPTTALRTLGVRPQAVGNLLYFVAALEDAAALMEYVFDDLTVSTRASNTSVHVPGLLPSTVKTIAAHPTSGLVFVLPAPGRYLHVYRTYFVDGEKRQSAWTRWRIDDTLTIIDIAVLGDRLYMLTKALSGSNPYVLEYIPLGREDAETGYPYAVHLDRRMTLTGVYNAGGNYTEFDLTPLPASGSTVNAYVQGPAFAVPGTYSIDASGWTYAAPPGTTIQIPGNLSAGAMIFGRYFSTELELSRPYRRDENGRAKAGEKLALLEMTLDHIDTGEYDVTVAGATSFVTSFDAGTAAVDAEGFLRAGLSCDPDQSTVTISDTSPRPMTIAGYQISAYAAENAR